MPKVESRRSKFSQPRQRLPLSTGARLRKLFPVCLFVLLVAGNAGAEPEEDEPPTCPACGAIKPSMRCSGCGYDSQCDGKTRSFEEKLPATKKEEDDEPPF